MQVFPVVSKVNGRFVAGATVENNAETLAKSINKFNGEVPVVYVGEPIPVNPSYSKAKDPERVMLTSLLAAALVVDESALAELTAAA
jgi:hypothetical protein